ncbi:type VI secretion system Vgr family protein [Trinickia sp. EG282A]|uniref:type VI secretion system Vgr family protein n=1 Tax=Trinickia sp. EG282A TaxID=3237013 RepID=UPI0034D34228
MSLRSISSTLRGGYAQYQRLIKLDTRAGPDRLVPLMVKGTAQLGRDYTFTVEAAAVRDGDPIDPRDLLGEAVTLWIQQAGGAYLPIHGYVHDFVELGTDGECNYYQLRFSSWLYFLGLRRDMRDWQEQRGEGILTDVFAEHRQAVRRYRFELRKPMPYYSYRMQREYDLDFVYRSLEEAGVFGRFEFSNDGKSHTLVIVDSIGALPPLEQQVVSLGHAGAGEEFDGFVSWRERLRLQSARFTASTFDYKRPNLSKRVQADTSTPESLRAQGEIYEYTGAYGWGAREDGERQVANRVEAWESQLQRVDAIGGLRAAFPGYWFTLSRNTTQTGGSSGDNEYVILGVDWAIRNNVPGMNSYPAFDDSLREEIEAQALTKTGSTIAHFDGSLGFFQVKVELQPRRAPFRLPREHRKPEMSLMSAIVDAANGEEVSTDRLNRVKVRYPWYRDSRASCWVRAAFADAGDQRGAIHPLRGGDEVLIDFLGGDCDRPVIVSRVFGGASEPVWHTNGLLSGYRSKEYGGSGYNELAMDDSTGQNRVRLYSTSYQTQLHLGYLIDHTNNTRGAFLGSGFDLKSDAYGAIRAGQGLYVSTHPASAVQPLNVAAASEQLTGAESVVDMASQASTANHAESLDDGLHALKRFTDATRYSVTGSMGSGGRTAGGGTGNANGFALPIMLLASPASMGLSTQDSMQVAANQHVNVVSGQSTHIATGKSLIASAMEKVSLFVQNAGMKLFAARGNVDIQAQSDAITASALKDITITSTDGRIVLSAEKEIWIGAGGSYIKITADGIENGTSGQIVEKCASWDKPGPATMRMPTQIVSAPKGCAWKLTSASGDSASSVALD